MSTIVTRSKAQTGGTAAKGSALSATEIDTNFINLNDDKYQSGDDVSVADLTTSGDVVFGTNASVLAAGSVQGDATAITSTYNVVTTASAAQGVKLPTASSGLTLTVVNNTAADIKVYPNTSGTIDDNSANVAFDLRANTSVQLVGISSTGWKTLTPAGVEIYDASGTRLN